MRWRTGAARVLDAARAAGVPTILAADIAPDKASRDLSARCYYAIFSRPGLAKESKPMVFCGSRMAANPAR